MTRDGAANENPPPATIWGHTGRYNKSPPLHPVAPVQVCSVLPRYCCSELAAWECSWIALLVLPRRGCAPDAPAVPASCRQKISIWPIGLLPISRGHCYSYLEYLVSEALLAKRESTAGRCTLAHVDFQGF